MRCWTPSCSSEMSLPGSSSSLRDGGIVAKSFRTETPISGDNGGGGNRTRVTVLRDLRDMQDFLGLSNPKDRLVTTYVYFIEAGEGGPVKVGISIDPDKRCADLQSNHFLELRILAVVPGDYGFEKRLHHKFAESRIRGEWFARTPLLDKVIEAAMTAEGNFITEGRWEL